MAAILAPKTTAVPLPTGKPAQNAYDAFVSVSAADLPASDKENALKNIWRNASREDRSRIENDYPGAVEQYGARRRRRTQKKRRSTKKTRSRR
jgi:hypothetical protein